MSSQAPESKVIPQESPLESQSPPIARNRFPLQRFLLLSAGAILLLSGFAIAAKEQTSQTPEPASNRAIAILPVQTTRIEPVTSYQVSRSYTGEVASLRASELGFERGGKLMAIAVDEGDWVGVGQELAYLDTSNLQARQQELLAGRDRSVAQLREMEAGPRVEAIAAARANRDRARAQLEELQAGARSEDIAAARAQQNSALAQLQELQAGPRSENIDGARAALNNIEEQLKLARLQRDRRQILYSEGAISREQLDQLDTEVRALQARLDEANSQLDELLAGTRPESIAAARARLDEADSRLEELLAGTRPERIAAARASLDQAQSQLDELLAGTRQETIAAARALVQQQEASIASVKIDIEKSVLTAPFSGIISARRLDEGTVVSQGQAILRLVEQKAVEVRIGIPASAISQLPIGSKWPIKIGEESYLARVASILPELDSSTRTQTAILILDSAVLGTVAPGQTARLELSQGIPTVGYWLPTAALVQGERGLWSCYALAEIAEAEATETIRAIKAKNPSTQIYIVEQRDLEVLYANGDRVLVRGTIQAGDSIVTGGAQRVVPGQLVRRATESFEF
ncbi:MAG: HlyD family efflux transporter periplasmic adaptor subunit [Oscillatoria sp. SIO1A7]|nr:HlyD family efflux transporter periplasmic adaptor subunit [Oscillatoria sp. SIO1A7]